MPENDKSDFIAKAKKRFAEISTDEEALRANFKLCLKFSYGEQWDPKVRMDREAAGRPALTFNRLPVFVQKIANEARQNKAQVKFNPRLEENKEVAEIKEGLARQIQYESDAEIAYDTAVEYSAAAGFGIVRLITAYCDDESFDQELKIIPVLDPLTVYGVLVPTAFNRKPTEVFIVEDVPIGEFKAMYPDSVMSQGQFDASQLEEGWASTETFRIAEYWYTETKRETLKKDGKEREVIRTKVCFCKMTGMEVLPGTETEWVTDEIPVYAVLGGSKIIEGKPMLFSLVQWQMDAQRMINFGKTRIAESLATAPISPFMVAEGQISGHEGDWQTANSTLRPYLIYKPEAIGGTVIGPPQRQTFEPPIQALSEFIMQEVDDLKATSGIFDQSLGAGQTDQSGIAIRSRQQQSDLTNFHFEDNLGRACKKLGITIAKAIPKVYDTPRVIKIIGPDEAAKMVQVNQEHQTPQGTKMFDLTKGDEDIVVTMGRAFSSKRLESFDMMQSIVQAAPNMLPMIGDIMFKNSDIAGADELAERFKKMLPPQLQDQQEGADPQQQLQQLMAQHQMLTEHLQQATQIIETKQVEQQAKIQVAKLQEDSRQAIVKMQEATKLAVAQINASKDTNQTFAELEIDQDNLLHTSAHEAAMQAVEHAHQRGMAQQQAAQQSALSAQNAGHQADLSAQNADQAQQQAAGAE